MLHLRYLIKELKAQPNEIILVGFSMGTAAAIHLAACEKVLKYQAFLENKVVNWTRQCRILRKKLNQKKYQKNIDKAQHRLQM